MGLVLSLDHPRRLLALYHRLEFEVQGSPVKKLCTTMRTEDVTDTLELALKASGCDQAKV